MNPLIIDMPDLQTIRQRYASTIITLIFWVFWFYLWLPLISLIAWLLGIDLLYDRMVVKGGFDAFVASLPAYILVIVTMGALLVIWGVYNLQRFRGHERRTHVHPVDTPSMARYFLVDPEQLAEWQQTKNLVVHIDELGMVRSVKTHEVKRQDGDATI